MDDRDAPTTEYTANADGTSSAHDPTPRPEVDASSEHSDASASEHPEPNDEKLYTGEPLETEDTTYRPRQMNVGAQQVQGSGEFPDPDAPAQPPAPGAVC